MPPRHLTNPAPKTESAREARKSFFCELCQKGYSRMNEFDAHEGSYDHQHKKRLKEMKQMQRDPNASEKARRAEQKANEKSGLISIKLGADKESASGGGGGFKKGGFKSAFAPVGDVKPPEDVVKTEAKGFTKATTADNGDTALRSEDEEFDSDDCGYEYYDPRKPTGCDERCRARIAI